MVWGRVQDILDDSEEWSVCVDGNDFHRWIEWAPEKVRGGERKESEDVFSSSSWSAFGTREDKALCRVAAVPTVAKVGKKKEESAREEKGEEAEEVALSPKLSRV